MITVTNARETAVTLQVGEDTVVSLGAGAVRVFDCPVRFDSVDYRYGPLYRDTLVVSESTSTPPVFHHESLSGDAVVVCALLFCLGVWITMSTIKGVF